jgi:hypothetical protein
MNIPPGLLHSASWRQGGRSAALGLALLVLTAAPAAAQAPAALTGSAPIQDAPPAVAVPGVRFTAPDSATQPLKFTFTPEELSALQQPADQQAADRACPACPKRRPGHALFQVFAVNLAFNLINRVRPPEEREQFQVGFKSWWENLKYGFEWDDNAFGVNQIGHPYQGGLYFSAGRANGLSFWESAPLAAFGSAMWEYFGEKNHASVNDLINTTAGGMALGEMLHRAGWLVRDPTKTGKERRRSEILAMLIDPITGLNRFISGDAGKVSEKPADLVPSRTVGDLEAGVLWRGDNTKAVNSAGEPYAQLNMGYGELARSPYRQPYDAFTVSLRLGGGAKISEATIRGRLYGRFVGKDNSSQFLVLQAYDFVSNQAYEFGGQSVVTAVASRFKTSERQDIVTLGGGGVIMLGAFSSPYLFGLDRYYDYGPGLWFGGRAVLRRDGLPIASIGYDGRYVHVVSGTNGDHLAQSFQLSGMLPVRGPLRLGAAAEYIKRKVYYDYEDDRDDRYPQFRIFLAWVNK